jgi:hypothetical protein
MKHIFIVRIKKYLQTGALPREYLLYISYYTVFQGQKAGLLFIPVSLQSTQSG